MSWHLTPTIKRVACAAVLSVGVVFFSLASTDAAPAPPHIQQWLPEASLWGQGQMRFLGMRIYDARLWAGPRFQAASYGNQALALELTYHRAFTGLAIAQRSIHEIERQGELPPAQADQWLKALTAMLPDVKPGDRLTGVYQPGLGMRLLHGNRTLGSIDDAELALRFFGIWLSPHTSEPGLRNALLTPQAEGKP